MVPNPIFKICRFFNFLISCNKKSSENKMFSLAPESQRESTCDHHKEMYHYLYVTFFVPTIENVEKDI